MPRIRFERLKDGEYFMSNDTLWQKIQIDGSIDDRGRPINAVTIDETLERSGKNFFADALVTPTEAPATGVTSTDEKVIPLQVVIQRRKRTTRP